MDGCRKKKQRIYRKTMRRNKRQMIELHKISKNPLRGWLRVQSELDLLKHRQVMADVSKYIEHIEEEEKRSHPFGQTNVLLNGLNGRKSKTTLDTGRSLTWIGFFCLVLGVCGAIIFLSARAATEVKDSDCKQLNLCAHKTSEENSAAVKIIPKIKTTAFTDAAVFNSTLESTTVSPEISDRTTTTSSLKKRLIRRMASRFNS